MSDSVFKVNEIFGPTIQGEGTNIGKPCMFIRLSGCDFQCYWCDTDHKSHELVAGQAIIKKLEDLSKEVRHVVITGGNPLLEPMLYLLCNQLQEAGYSVEIETQGSVPAVVPNFVQLNISPKSPSTGNLYNEDQYFLKIEENIIIHDNVTLKFVTDGREADTKFIERLLKRLEDHCMIQKLKDIIIQPVNKKDELDTECLKDVAEYWMNPQLSKLQKSTLDKIRVLTQLHKIIWPGQQGV